MTVKEPNKRKPAGNEKPAGAKKDQTKVIRLDDLIAPPGVRGGRKTFFGGKQSS